MNPTKPGPLDDFSDEQTNPVDPRTVTRPPWVDPHRPQPADRGAESRRQTDATLTSPVANPEPWRLAGRRPSPEAARQASPPRWWLLPAVCGLVGLALGLTLILMYVR